MGKATIDLSGTECQYCNGKATHVHIRYSIFDGIFIRAVCKAHAKEINNWKTYRL